MDGVEKCEEGSPRASQLETEYKCKVVLIQDNTDQRLNSYIYLLQKGLAAQSKAEAIGQNKISSANQRPGFQMIFFSFWSGLIYCYELCVYGSKVMIVVEYSVHEQHMNPFICPFPLEKD